jgi:hypothetical protein
MESDEQRPKVVPHFAVSLAACHWYLNGGGKHVMTGDWSELRPLWLHQAEALAPLMRKVATLEELIVMVSPAWPLEVGEGGVVVCLRSGAVIFGGDSVTFDPSDGASEEEEEEGEEEEVISIRRRQPVLPQVFPVQNDAFAAADILPPGFLWVWARDTYNGRKGSKQYVVAGLDDFWTYYRGVPAEKRNFYELIRRGPLCFHADLEYSLKLVENASLEPEPMVEAIKRLVTEQWEEEMDGMELDQSKWELTESCDHEKISFHLSHPDMAFCDHLEHGAFCRRVEARAGSTLRVMRAQKNDPVPKAVFFMDLSIYTMHRCFRLVYSTKAGEMRFLLPIGQGERERLQKDAWERNLVQLSRPPAHLLPRFRGGDDILMEEVPAHFEEGRGEEEGGSELIAALRSVVQNHFQPESMRNHTLDNNGMCTFSMINHNCNEICNDVHNNQVYAVADLKRRVFYQKCHADRNKKGPDHPFPPSLTGSSLVDGPRELVPGGFGNMWTLPEGSPGARLVLSFCRSVFGATEGSVPGRIPENGAVTYDSTEHHYLVALGMCETDGGQLFLTLNQSGVSIRCAGAANPKCTRSGWRLERPSRSSAAHNTWNLSFILPTALPDPPGGAGGESAEAAGGGGGGGGPCPQEVFLGEPNFFKAIGFDNDEGTIELYTERIKGIESWAKLRQTNAPPEQRNRNGVHELASRVQHKASILRSILLDRDNLTAYRECLKVAPDFVYPVQLLPKGPVLLLVALWVFLAKNKGFKRSLNDFYVPTEVGERFYYATVPLDQLLTRVCSFDQTPNLCALMWSSRTTGDMERMLKDENHWPSIQPSKRYLGFRNAVYDLEQNVSLTWSDARKDPTVMPFNCLEEDLPLDALDQARRHCPVVTVTAVGGGGADKEVIFTPSLDGGVFIETPLFDQLLIDQDFDAEVRHWKYGLFGRMFHRVGKNNGDNWEICHIALGAPGTGKSSEISVLQSYLQPGQFGVIATKTEKRFPITSLQGMLMVFLTETGGCDLDKELLKQMISGDPVTVATKFKMASTLSNWDVPVWMAGNQFLDCIDPDGSLERRCGVFPYTRLLPQGQGDVGLVRRIIEQERALILIKCNTLYLAMKRAIREPIHPLLPSLVKRATSQALMQKDSLRMYLMQQHVSESGNVAARIAWKTFWEKYLEWCRYTGNRPYTADPHCAEIRTMVDKVGGRFTVHKGSMWLVYIRARLATDKPFESAFQVRTIDRAAAAAAAGGLEQGEDTIQWTSSSDEE